MSASLHWQRSNVPHHQVVSYCHWSRKWFLGWWTKLPLVAVSDGLFKESFGIVVLIIEGNDETKHFIAVMLPRATQRINPLFEVNSLVYSAFSLGARPSVLFTTSKLGLLQLDVMGSLPSKSVFVMIPTNQCQ
jgi:hypothetical protein